MLSERVLVANQTSRNRLKEWLPGESNAEPSGQKIVGGRCGWCPLVSPCDANQVIQYSYWATLAQR